VNERRRGRYDRIYQQLRELIEGNSPNLVAAMATIVSVLHAKMEHHFWTGFYFANGSRELHVGPYQGPLACQVLRSGVCVDAVRAHSAVVVDDVDAYPGHIACDGRSRSEIAVPVGRDGVVTAVLDIDAAELAQFSQEDIQPLERILSLLEPYL
jgi:L-methionine (R)-S-oxide reductase